MSRRQATVYLVALAGWTVGFLLVLMSPGRDGVFNVLVEAVATPVAFICFSTMLGLAVMRVQRGEVAAERDDVLFPSMAEFVLMSFGGRVPMALARLRG